MKTNFIFASLCDNDFIYLEEAVFRTAASFYTLTEQRFKYCVIKYLMHKEGMRNASNLDDLEGYLNSRLIIYFLEHLPENIDHDGGSVLMDIKKCYAWKV